MKAIYSFSGLPFADKHGERFTGGFKTKKAFLACARESISGARLSFEVVELYVDTNGKKLLKPLLSLFDKVIEIETSKDLLFFFSQSKIQAYLMQSEPFLHIDFDLILKAKLSASILKSPFIVEFPELYKWYRDRAYSYHKLSTSKNPILSDYFSKSIKNPLGYNCGVFGGYDIDFIQQYAKTVSIVLNDLAKLTFPKDMITVLFIEQGLARIHSVVNQVAPTYLYGTMDYKHYIGNKKLEYN